MLNGLGNLVALPFQLFFLSRLIGSVGLGNSALMFPLTTVASAASLIGFPGLAAAGFGYLDRSILRTTLRNPIESLLANAVPLRVRARARAFIGGLVMPFGSLVGGVLLACANQMGDWGITLMAVAVVGFSAVYLLAAWVTRRQYAQALVAMLEQEDYSFLLSQEASDLTLTDPATLNRLKEKMEKPGASPELTIFVAQLMTQVGGDAALPLLGQAARAATDPRVRAGMLDVLAASDVQSSALAQLYTEFLADREGAVRQSALAGLEELAGKTDTKLASLALKMLDDPDQDVRLRSLLISAKCGGLDEQSLAAQKLDEFLTDESPQRRAQGIRVLAQGCDKGGQVCSVGRLAGFLRDPSDQVRLEAALAVEVATAGAPSGSVRAADYSTAVCEAMTALLQDPVERIRQAALVVLGRVGTASARPSLVNALADPSSQVRATAADVLAQLGKCVVPLVHPQLDSQDPKRRKMAAVVLSRINPREFGPVLIGTHVTGNLLAIYRNIGRMEALASWSRYAGMGAISGALREQNQQLLDEILYLLTAIHSPASVKIIADSLHSDDPHTRANAVEALEALTTPQTTHLIAPLFEPETSPAELLRLSQSTWEMQHPDPCGVIFQLAGDQDDWLRAMLAFALGELGSDVRQGSQPQPPTLTGLQIQALLQTLTADPAQDVRLAAQAAQRKMEGEETSLASREGTVLSTVEKVIFLKDVPFFQGMTIEQLKVLANVCEETFAPAETRLFVEGDPGGTLYVVVSGRVAIEQEKRKGSFARISTIEAHSYFGEMSLFDNSPHSTVATSLQDTLLLLIRREPLMALIRQHPELSLELIKVLNARLREANARVAELTRTRPRELHKLFDQLS
jgi:HEAT repeat protein